MLAFCRPSATLVRSLGSRVKDYSLGQTAGAVPVSGAIVDPFPTEKEWCCLIRPLLLALAVILAALAATLTGVHTAQAESCSERFSQADQQQYVRSVYRRPSISRPARRRMARMVRCAHSPKAAANMRDVRKEMARRRQVRKLRPFVGPRGHHWAIPYRIIRCESRGSWTAYNRSGAKGPYQLLGHGAPWPANTRAKRRAHHRIAARLWRTSGGAPWVCR